VAGDGGDLDADDEDVGFMDDGRTVSVTAETSKHGTGGGTGFGGDLEWLFSFGVVVVLAGVDGGGVAFD
jgi:hypothetical protein